MSNFVDNGVSKARFRIYDINNPSIPSRLFTVSTPLANNTLNNTFALDPQGNVYLSAGTDKVAKYNAEGTLQWQKSTGSPIKGGIYSYSAGANDFRVAR